MNSILAYSYVRMSTNLQLKGDSLRRQTELSKAYAEEHGLRLVSDTELQDIGVSAYKGDNVATGALGKFLASAKAGQVPEGSYLLVESLDRLTRQELLPSVQLLLDIIGLSINVVTLLDGKVYSKTNADMASMMFSIALMSRAHEESQTKSRRIGAAWKAKRDRAGEQKLTKICPAWLSLVDDKKTFQVVKDRQEIVKRIFELTDEGMGSYSVTKWLNQQSIPPFGRTSLWNQSYVTKILQNRAVLGEYQPHVLIDGRRRPEGDPIPDYFPRIIDEALFYRVQQARRSRASGSGGRRGETQRNLFTHIAKCGYCGSPMRLINKGKGPKGGTYLKCHKALAGGACSKTSWRYNEFEQSFLFFIREIDLDGIVNAAARLDTKKNYERIQKGLAAKLQHENLRRERLFDLLGDERQNLSVLKERLVTVEQQIKQIHDEIASLEPPSGEDSSYKLSSAGLLDLISSIQGDGSLDRRVKLAAHLKSLIKTISLETEGDGPRRGEIDRWIGEEDTEFRNRFLKYREEMDEQFGRTAPSFTVHFVDGRSRLVRVRRGSPTNFIQMLAGDGMDFGEIGNKVEWNGTRDPGWYVENIEIHPPSNQRSIL